MKGEIGILKKDNEQVAGFLDWETRLPDVIEAKIGDTVPLIVIANPFWLVEDIPKGVYTMTLFQRNGDELRQVLERAVFAEWPPCITDKLIHYQITMKEMNGERSNSEKVNTLGPPIDSGGVVSHPRRSRSIKPW